MVLGPTVSASLGSLLEMQDRRPHTDPTLGHCKRWTALGQSEWAAYGQGWIANMVPFVGQRISDSYALTATQLPDPLS